jgi:hypothetical protein
VQLLPEKFPPHQCIGGSYVIHPKNLSVKEGVVYLPAYMTFRL